MNNSVFGKIMENIRNHVDVRLVNDRKKAFKLAAKPNFEHCTIFNENLIAIHMKRTKPVSDKPVDWGISILDISKTLMYDLHYKYEDGVKLLFTDTDSLVYENATKGLYKHVSGDIEARFDTSNSPKDHPSDILTDCNKRVVGMMKDEACEKIIEEFVG